MRDSIDDLLDQSSPPSTPETEDVRTEIALLHVQAEALSGTRQSPRWVRPAVAGFAAIALIGGVATAAAATGQWTLPWAAGDAVASFTFTGPSGVQCEQRIGGVAGMEPHEVAAVENFYRTVDFDALLSPEKIEQTIASRREPGGGLWVNPDGSTEPSGIGTDHYNADEEYQMAVWDVVVTALDADLARQGIDGIDTGLTFQGEYICAGADG